MPNLVWISKYCFELYDQQFFYLQLLFKFNDLSKISMLILFYVPILLGVHAMVKA